MLSDEWLPRYRLLENFNIKWNGNGNAHGNGNAYDHGDYNSSFALRAVELKISIYPGVQKFRTQNRSGQTSDEVPPPPQKKKKKKKRSREN